MQDRLCSIFFDSFSRRLRKKKWFIKGDETDECFDFSSHLLDEASCCLHSSSSREKVIHKSNPLTWFYSISLYLDTIVSVLEWVVGSHSWSREFPLLPDHDEWLPEYIRDSCAEDESSCIETCDDIGILRMPCHLIARVAKCFRMSKKRWYISKEYPWLWEVWISIYMFS